MLFRNTHQDQDRDRDKEDREDKSTMDSDKAHQCLVGWVSILVASQVHHQWGITLETKEVKGAILEPLLRPRECHTTTIWAATT